MHGLKRRGLETEHQPPRQSPTLLSAVTGRVHRVAIHGGTNSSRRQAWGAPTARWAQAPVITEVRRSVITGEPVPVLPSWRPDVQDPVESHTVWDRPSAGIPLAPYPERLDLGP